MKESKILIVGFALGIFTGGILGYSMAEKDAEAEAAGGAIEIGEWDEQTYAAFIYGEPNEGDVLLQDPNGNYTWVSEDEPNETELTYDVGGGDLTLTLPDPNNLMWPSDVYLEVTLTEEPNFAETDRVYLYEGDEFNVVIEKVEPNESNFAVIIPNNAKIHLGWNESKEVWEWAEDEPNEPECEHKNKTYSGCLVVHPPGVTCETCLDCGEYVVSEPELTFGEAYWSELEEGGYTPETLNLNALIPTWPDYIELEKELVIDPIAPNYSGVHYIFPKGTKIYFKGKAE